MSASSHRVDADYDATTLGALHAQGEERRRAVVGSAHVDRSLAAASAFTQPMQDLATTFAWGHVWNRPGLSFRDRSLLNIGMLVALNRSPELAVHTRGALTNGIGEEELREALLQAATYCGMPAGMEAFRVADKALAEWKAEHGFAPEQLVPAQRDGRQKQG